MSRVLIVDDDDAFRESLGETLVALGHEVVHAGNGVDGLAVLDRGVRIDAVFLDFRMPGLDGVEVLRRLRGTERHALTPVIMLTAFASAGNTIESMKLGAFDHLAKPLGRADIESVLQRALKPGTAPTAAPIVASSATGETLIGNGPAMREVQKMIGRAAAATANVLISGETGTGKELVARLLHRASRRGAAPFVAVNCAAIPADLLESELFGHVRGAFTGAVATRRGSFREADGGSLFLDEIGDMPPAMQAKILRAVQEREITPLGADRAQPVYVRIIAATHRDLAAAVGQGRFRQDLFFRLNVVPITLPPLRQRPDDIVSLATHFLGITATGAPKQLSTGALRRLLAYPWPGNVRELRNVIERLGVVVRGPVIEGDDLDFLATVPPLDKSAADGWMHLPLPEALLALERAMIVRALAATGGNRTEAARRLGIHRQLLYAKLKQHGLGD